MALERQVVNRQPFIYYSGALTAGQTLFAAMSLSQTPVFALHGQKRLIGSVSSSAAPATGFPRLRFNGTGSNSTFDLVIPLVRDTSQSGFVYPFDVPCFLPYATIELTDGGAGSTVKVMGWAYPEGSGPANFSSSGGGPAPSPQTATKLAIDFSTAAAQTVIAAVAGQTIRIYHYELISSGSTSLTFRSGATAYSAAMPLVATQGLAFDAPGGFWPIELASGQAWVIVNSAAVQVSGFVLYTQG